MHAIILAGGFGTRLKSVVADVPKPLAPVAGRPFLAWLLDALAKDGVTSVTLSVHHQWQKIRGYFDAHPPGMPLTYAVEKEPLGTGGAIRFAMKVCQAKTPAIVVNGDTFVKVDYAALYRQHCHSGAMLTMVLRQVPDTARYGEVVVAGDIIQTFRAGRSGKAGLINAGIYVITPGFFDAYNLAQVFAFEQDFMIPFVGQIKPHSYLAEDYFIDIGIPEDYARAQKELPTV